jgi:hypothetical protein
VDENIAQHDGFVVNLVARRIDEREAPLLRDCPKLVHECGIVRQFGCISMPELFPPAWVVTEPAAELRARRHLFRPTVERGVRFAHAAGPEAIYQDADTVFARRRQVGPLPDAAPPTQPRKARPRQS